MARSAVSLAIMGGIWASISIASSAMGGESVSSEDARAILQAEYPGVQFYKQGDRITRVYGRTFGYGDSPEEPAEHFTWNYAELFGVTYEDLIPVSLLADGRHTQPIKYDRDTGDYAFTLVYYSQYKDNLPVFRADLRLLVSNEPGYPLVWAGSALRDLGNFTVDVDVSQLSAEIGHAEALVEVPSLVNFTAPTTVVWAGVGEQVVKPRVAVEFIADNGMPATADYEKWLFIADAVTGRILYKENLIIDVDVEGNVSGMATQGVGADICEPEAVEAMPWARVNIGGTVAYADENGDFVIPNGGSSSVTVESPVWGQWFRVVDQAGTGTVLSQDVIPPGPANFVHNASNSEEYVRAEVNAYIESNVVRDFTLTYNPLYPVIWNQSEFAVNVNINSSCNAYYDGSSINFYRAGGGCSNTANTVIVHHEYGHHLVGVGGSGQDEYGEGMGDVMGVLITDTPKLAIGFYSDDCVDGIRNADNNLQYPCSGEIHFCGQLISGCVWSTRNELAITHPDDYTDILANLAINSILMHSGGGIDPSITIDFLTLDDDDGNIGNGTPHYTEICAGFGDHSMDCPPLDVGISIAPTSDFFSSGDVGGPFAPESMVYTVENISEYSIDYSINKSADWVTLSSTGGTLAPQETAEVTVSINSNADSLPMDRFEDAVNFVNETDHLGDTSRDVNLAVGIPDYCEQATTVCPGTYSDSTTDMTNDGSATCGDSNSTPDIWYNYTPDSDGSATFSLCTGTNYDSVLSVHSGCPGTGGNELGCDDDGCAPGGPSTVTLSVTAGNIYLIRVTGWNGSTGSFTLDVSGPDCAPETLTISYPDGLPEFLEPGVSTTFSVQIEDGEEIYVPGTGMLHYRYDGEAFLTSPLTLLDGDVYEATLPAAGCEAVPEFYISAQGDGGTTITSPADAPANTFTARVGVLDIVMEDDFETDQGWTVSGNALDGQWSRGVPAGGGDRGDPATDYDNSGQCYLTDNVDGNSDVDDGSTILTSPVIDLSGTTDPDVTYARWFSNDFGDSPFTDTFVVEVSDNAGNDWVNLETVGPTGPEVSGGWFVKTFRISDVVPITSEFQIRFTASDLDPPSVVEAGIDAFVVSSLVCVPPVCEGDANGDDTVDPLDAGYVLSRFGCPVDTGDTDCDAADVNGDGVVDPLDSGFVLARFGACP